ncbi:MAG: methyltransferase domain-containing protein [Bryobacteraceae bacterium]|jgi:SAM-dependent methyltransferase|nr:methyltransferase domain-containing protein [Bryobacteraceae bacterium]
MAKRAFGRPVLLHVRPLRDRRLDERGWCVACGRATRFIFNSLVIPEDLHAFWRDPAVSAAYTRRESMFCRHCCASLRVRRIAETLVRIYGRPSQSVAALVRDEAFRMLRVAEINTIGAMGALHALLRRHPRLAFSEYRGPDRLGEIVEGVRNEDICRLTYPAGAFDLLLSSDTLEHVPDFAQALRETRRVLRPGGRHIFTVPIVASRASTEVRAEIGEGGRILHRLPPLYHGRGAGLYRRIPVGDDFLTFTEFGRDLSHHLRQAGFDPIVHGADDATGATMVFEARVPG